MFRGKDGVLRCVEPVNLQRAKVTFRLNDSNENNNHNNNSCEGCFYMSHIYIYISYDILCSPSRTPTPLLKGSSSTRSMAGVARDDGGPRTNPDHLRWEMLHLRRCYCLYTVPIQPAFVYVLISLV